MAAIATVGPSSPIERETMPDAAAAIVGFWWQAGPAAWFAKDAAFDRGFRDRFLRLHEAAVRGDCDGWAATPYGALALLLLLDQFPRNAFRDTPRMYASDDKARAIAAGAIDAGFQRRVDPSLRLFFGLPFAHSEAIADQDRSVELARDIGPSDQKRAEHHRDIIRRFGRFPHRNPILGRAMRTQEQRYLDEGGYAG